MKSETKRLFAAGFLSASSFALTFVWYFVISKPKVKLENSAQSIAYLQKTRHEVHKRAATRSLWEPAEVGDPLFVGDRVRTSSQGDARIQFSQIDKIIDVEPESLVEIYQNEKEISLNLMEGSVFVNEAQGSPSTSASTAPLNLTVTTQGGGKIDVTKSTVHVSGSSQNKLDIKVIKGTATFKKQGVKSESIEAGNTGGIGLTGIRVSPDRIKILSPDTTKPLMISAENPNPILIKWEGFPADSQVFLESGNNRKNLFPMPSEKISKNELKVRWKEGTYFWKLKAIDPDTQSVLGESTVFKSEVVARWAPIPLTPESNFVIYSRKSNESVTLRWSSSIDYSDVQVELFNDLNGLQILNKKFPNSQDSQEVQNLPLGNYRWRLTAFTNTGLTLTGNFHRFSIQEKRIIKIPIVWNPQLPSVQHYVNSEPKINLQWSAEDTERIRKWRVRLAPEGTDLSKAAPFEARSQKFEKTLSQKGRYQATVEAIDDDGDVLGSTDPRVFVVEELPLLQAPSLNQESGDFLAKGDGTLTIGWKSLTGAKSYNLLIRDQTGKIVIENSTEANVHKFVNLMPGDYEIQIGATDNFGRRGDLSMKRRLLVPSKSEVKAPKLKKIKID